MEKGQISIQVVEHFSTEVADALKILTPKIGNNYKQLTDADIQEMISSPNTFILLAREEVGMKIRGMITLLVIRIPYVRKASIEDLIVDEAFRGQGVGSLLFARAVTLAKEKGVGYIDFTSRPRRVAGNKLYEKLGFFQRETNVYRKVIDYKEV
jgi:ribosomal protein S18 acetylase RimI-like enzyme